MRGSVARLAGVFALVLVAASSAFGQAVSTASIAGTIRDASGAMLPGVTVTATQTGTGLTRTAVSDATGGYLLTQLPVGPYRLEFTLQGFRTSVQQGIVLQVNTNPTINATLELGELAETIQVEANSPLIETRSPCDPQKFHTARIRATCGFLAYRLVVRGRVLDNL
jgi:hypothetical protein